MLGIPPGHERGCARAREWVSLRLDGELSELERLFLKRHLGRCADCRAYAVSVGAVTRAVREAPYEAPSRSLRPEPAAGRPSAPRRVSLSLRAAAVAALVVVAAGLGIAVGAQIGPADKASPARSNSRPKVIVDLSPGDVPVRPRPVGRTANV